MPIEFFVENLILYILVKAFFNTVDNYFGSLQPQKEPTS